MTNQTESPMVGIDTMGTEKALDAMMSILPDVAKILNDSEAEAMIKQLKGKEAAKVEAGDAFRKLVPLFANKYKSEFLRIVAACQGGTVDEVKNQSLTKTTAVFAASLRVMTGFFGCCLHMARNM